MGSGSREDNGAHKIWAAILGELEVILPSSTFATWLQGTRGVSFGDNRLIVSAPNLFATEWLQQHAPMLLRRTALKATGAELDIHVLPHDGETPGAAPRPAVKATTNEPPKTPAPLFRNGFPNRRYSFDSFVVGPSNNLSYNAALAVASAQGRQYNPLFIYSGVGLGKTHLLHAIAHKCMQRQVNLLYVTSEQFTNEFIGAIRRGSTENFLSRYRTADVLLMDDIQFMGGKEQTLEGFFHTFNDLHSCGRQIVITSDKAPRAMPYLEERIRSRFSWGLTTDIQEPDFETRVAILQNKANEMGVQTDSAVLSCVAERTTGSIRELEGAFNRVVATAQLNDQPLTVDAAEDILDGCAPCPSTVAERTPEQALGAVAASFHVDVASITGGSRRKELVRARHAAMHIMKRRLNLPVSQIARELGGKNHATVIHGIKRADGYLKSDAGFRAKLQATEAELARFPR